MNTLDRLTASLSDRYRLDRELGQGGMATVYLAEDLKHSRKVAIKVLHPELSAVIGGDRFLTEIKVTANLQHPHILGLIDSGAVSLTTHDSRLSDDSRLSTDLLYYVMPYVSGESLRNRLARDKQLPIDDALRLAKEVASALDYAHRQGVVHRDIKPENILLQDGSALVADFGIALAVQQAGGSRMTQTGMSLGTPAYMSPEQAMGERDIGARSDVYALGAMTYEMLTGEPPFTGLNSQAIVAKVLTEQPPLLRLKRPLVPSAVENAVLTALQKLPADRFGTPKDFADALDGTGKGGQYAATVQLSSSPQAFKSSRQRLPVLAALVLTAILAALAGRALRAEPPLPVSRFGLAFPAAQVPRGMFALTPDAAQLVYAGPADSGQQIWVKERDRYEATPLAGTANASSPTVSPDGKWVAFVQKGQLKKVPITGGAATTLADSAFASGGMAWLDDGSVVYTTPDVRRLMRVPEQGGISTVAWKPDAVGRFSVFPTPLPGARGVLFNSCTNNCASSDLWVLDLKSGHAKSLVPGVLRGWYLPSGHVAYVGRDGQMFAAQFDLKALEIRGTPVPVLAGIALAGGIIPRLAISSTGTLVTQVGGRIGGLARYQMVWVDRAGVATPVDTAWTFSLTQSGANVGWALSPDGSRLAIGLNTSSGDDIWIKQLATGPLSRLTLDSIPENRPRWTPDGQSVTYLINTTTLHVLRQRRADGTGADETRLDLKTTTITEGSWSPDGKWLVLRSGGAQGQRGARDILGIRPGVDSAPVPLAADPRYDEAAPMLSPDGRWLAYESDETGKTEIYVRPFPNTEGGKWQVSVNGGQAPLWAHSGKEIFFVDGARTMVAAPVLPGASFQLGERRTLFRLDDDFFLTAQEHYTPFDITPDDKRFIMAREVRSATEAAPTFLLVENWFTELKSKMAAK